MEQFASFLFAKHALGALTVVPTNWFLAVAVLARLSSFLSPAGLLS